MHQGASVLGSGFSLVLCVYFGTEYLYHSRIPFLLILYPAAHLKKETPEIDTDKWVGEVFKVLNILSLSFRSRWT